MIFSDNACLSTTYICISCSARLYEHLSGQGQVITLTDKAVEDLVEMNFDGKMSSIKITGPCKWILYTDNNFNGEAIVLEPGAYASLGLKDDTFSSLRPLPPQGATAAVLFEDANFCGRMLILTKKYNRLNRMAFNDKTSSIIITGGTWAVSQHAWRGMEGHTKKYGPGDYSEVPKKLRQKISLVRLVEK